MAIFIVLLSVSFVSAVDTTDVAIADDAADDESVENTTGDDDAADDEATDEDQDDEEEDLDVGDNPYRHGELTANEKAALADSPDGAGNAAGSADNAKTTNVNTNATGNPLLVLVVALAALGIYPLSRRK
ncbi:hypothetical protein [Methanobrevibacter sp.]|uniref:hypothetical protein n=1 Tax=Methanobrevibacter sp. TaxID=66852 RepID=UPI003867B7CF